MMEMKEMKIKDSEEVKGMGSLVLWISIVIKPSKLKTRIEHT